MDGMTGFTLMQVKELVSAQKKFRGEVLEELAAIRKQQDEILTILRGFQQRAKKK
jgi:hypothetical protein